MKRQYKIIYVPILLIFCLITGCSNKSDMRVMHIRYSSGNDSLIFQYHIINNDTIKDGLAKLYNKKGTIVAKVSFAKNLLHGEQKYYYDNGQLKESVFYNHGVAIGKGQFFYENGNKRLNTFYYKGYQIFAESFSPNQKRELFNVLFPPREDSVFYVVLFDSTGKKYYQNGHLLSRSFELFNTTNVYVNKPFTFQLFCTQLPGYVTKVSYSIDDNPDQKQCIVKDFFAKGSFLFKKTGINKVTFWCELSDENEQAVVRNLVEVFVDVK